MSNLVDVRIVLQYRRKPDSVNHAELYDTLSRLAEIVWCRHYHYTEGSEEKADLQAEAIVRLMEVIHSDKFDATRSPSNCFSFLYKVVRNVYTNRLKKLRQCVCVEDSAFASYESRPSEWAGIDLSRYYGVMVRRIVLLGRNGFEEDIRKAALFRYFRDR